MSNYNNKILLLVFISFTISFSCLAQSQSADSVALQAGSWALQFGIAQNFTLTSFQGSTIGAKYQLSPKNAIRGGITINGSTIDGPALFSGAIGDSSVGNASGSASSKSANVSFVLQYLWFMNPKAPVHFFTGLGPLISYGYSQNSNDEPYIFNSSGKGYWERDQHYSEYTQWAIGGAAVVGVEWFAAQWLSIHAEYNESIQYQWRTTSVNSNYNYIQTANYFTNYLNNSGSTKGWSLFSSGVSFGLNIYL